MPVRDFAFYCTDSICDRLVYHCVLEGSCQLWLVHPVPAVLSKTAKHHQQFNQHFLAAFFCSFKQGYHQFDALVIASLYASSRYWQLTGCVRPQGMNFPIIHLQPPSQTPLTRSRKKNSTHALGLYPVVDHSSWITRLANTGITTLQLRLKNLPDTLLEQEIARAVRLARTHHIRLFINDHWQLAIKHQAYGIHLGQEDLATAHIKDIKAAGLQIGVSTHCHFEVAHAISVQPDYLAIGPIFATQTKTMAFTPQGLAGLHYWRRQLQGPLVAIAGINQNNIDTVIPCIDAQQDGVALISAITQAKHPEATAQNMQRHFIAQSRHTQ